MEHKTAKQLVQEQTGASFAELLEKRAQLMWEDACDNQPSFISLFGLDEEPQFTRWQRIRCWRPSWEGFRWWLFEHVDRLAWWIRPGSSEWEDD